MVTVSDSRLTDTISVLATRRRDGIPPPPQSAEDSPRGRWSSRNHMREWRHEKQPREKRSCRVGATRVERGQPARRPKTPFRSCCFGVGGRLSAGEGPKQYE